MLEVKAPDRLLNEWNILVRLQKKQKYVESAFTQKQ